MSYQTEPVTMWSDRRLTMRHSPIHGVGTFATDAIRAGEALVWVTGGLVFSGEAWRAGAVSIAAEMYNQERLGGDLFLITPKGFQYYINHSCAPSAVDLSQHPTWTHYVALRDITANEEITADYYDLTTLERCACGAPECRWPAKLT
jgi:SET domain-containing protein